MSYFWYRVHYAFWMWEATRCPLAYAWSSAQAFSVDEWVADYANDITPKEAVYEELSQWTP